MKRIYYYVFVIIFALSACNVNKSSQTLFDGDNIDHWKTNGDVTIENQTFNLGNEASMLLKNGNYKDFELKLTARTVDNGKGYIAFHTDKNGNNGYKVALNNDIENLQWWTKTGSLLGIRNLTKSLVETNVWFDMTIRVEGKKIVVKIDDKTVVEYIEPINPYRTSENADQLLSKGSIFIKNTGDGDIEFKHIDISPINVSDIDINEQQSKAIDETSDEIIKLHQDNFPVLDYHIHLKGGITGEIAAEQSRNFGINYALAPNCGIGFPITNDQQVIHYLDSMKGQPFIQGMQGEGREWPTTFSKEVRDKFDYVFTDAMTFTDSKGRRTRLWIPEEVWIENEQQYIDLIVQKIIDVTNEPIDIYVNSTFLPDALSDKYDELWTNERMDKVIYALKTKNIALEINNRYKIPHKAFIEKAKEAGLKFTFGTNNTDKNIGKLEYCIQMKKECGITANDMFKPKMKN
ncbi:MAG: family 16 glycoside hydrolase [Dysgonamonadaceae bacterium]|nr:family 16 glycoside hydrolase [Dysgonamonadaceae bacterium]